LVRGAALARRHPAHHLRAVLLAAGGVERALLARDPLHDDARGLVGEDAHGDFLASSTAFFAPSAISAAMMSGNPESASIFLPCWPMARPLPFAMQATLPSSFM